MWMFEYPDPYAGQTGGDLHSVYVMRFNSISCPGLALDPEYVSTVPRTPPLPCTKEEAVHALRKLGWNGKHEELRLIWLPAFLYNIDSHGILLWHGLDNHGISWLCAKGVVVNINDSTCGLDGKWRGVDLTEFREKVQ